MCYRNNKYMYIIINELAAIPPQLGWGIKKTYPQHQYHHCTYLATIFTYWHPFNISTLYIIFDNISNKVIHIFLL